MLATHVSFWGGSKKYVCFGKRLIPGRVLHVCFRKSLGLKKCDVCFRPIENRRRLFSRGLIFIVGIERLFSVEFIQPKVDGVGWFGLLSTSESTFGDQIRNYG